MPNKVSHETVPRVNTFVSYRAVDEPLSTLSHQYLENIDIQIHTELSNDGKRRQRRSDSSSTDITLRFTLNDEPIKVELAVNEHLVHPQIEVILNDDEVMDIDGIFGGAFDGTVKSQKDHQVRGWARIVFHGPPSENQA